MSSPYSSSFYLDRLFDSTQGVHKKKSLPPPCWDSFPLYRCSQPVQLAKQWAALFTGRPNKQPFPLLQLEWLLLLAAATNGGQAMGAALFRRPGKDLIADAAPAPSMNKILSPLQLPPTPAAIKIRCSKPAHQPANISRRLPSCWLRNSSFFQPLRRHKQVRPPIPSPLFAFFPGKFLFSPNRTAFSPLWTDGDWGRPANAWPNSHNHQLR